MSIKNAFEFEEMYGPDGKLRKRRFTIGGIFIWGIVVLVLALGAHALSVPSLVTRLIAR